MNWWSPSDTQRSPDECTLPCSLVLSDYLTMDVHEALARLKVPTLVLWGREQADVLPKANEAFKRINANLTIHVVPQSRAQLQAEQAVQFNNLVREFAGAAVSR